MLKDPVCGMSVTDKSFHHAEQDGRLYYFCGAKCKARFIESGRHPLPGAAGPGVWASLVAWLRRLKWSLGWALSLALLATLLLASRWILSP